MRSTKRLTCTAMITGIVFGFVCVGSASATFDTALCSEASATLACPSNKLIQHVHFVDPAGELLTDFIDVSCTALFLGNVLNKNFLGPAPEKLAIFGEFTYTNCNNGCTVKEVANPTLGGHLLILKTAADLGTVTFDEFEKRVVCPGLIECTYTYEGVVAHMLSAALPLHSGLITAHSQAIPHLSLGILDICPGVTELDLLLQSLTDLWIRS